MFHDISINPNSATGKRQPGRPETAGRDRRKINMPDVVGLFRGKAILLIDGNERIVAEGERTPEGVALIRATSTQAVLEIDGQQSVHTLGGRVTTSYAQKPVQRVSIYRNARGMFTTVGSINGLPVNFLVDTGASAVAMSAMQAKRLGIPYRLEGSPTTVQTASGTTRAFAVKLDTIKVGDILQRDVDAFVLERDNSALVLLGMSYLSRVRIENDGRVMHLERKY